MNDELKTAKSTDSAIEPVQAASQDDIVPTKENPGNQDSASVTLKEEGILALLNEVHGIQTEYGVKFTCPFCGQNKMEATPKGFAKCFNPECGEKILASDGTHEDGFFAGVLRTLLRIGQLANQPDDNPCVRYLLGRGINRDVLSVAKVIQIPSSMDWRQWDQRMDMMVEASRTGKAEKKPGADDEVELPTNEYRDAYEKLRAIVNNNPGKIGLVFEDKKGGLCGLKVRTPELHRKEFKSWNYDTNKAAIFRIRAHNIEALPVDHKTSTVTVEGEMNALRAAGLFLAQCGGTPEIISIGSSTNVNGLHIALRCPNPIYIPDNDEAGESVVACARTIGNFRVARLPEGVKDLDDFIGGLPNDEQSFKAVLALLDHACSEFQKLEDLKVELEVMRRDRTLGPRIMERVVSDLVGPSGRGRPYYDENGAAYVFMNSSRRLLEVHSENRILLQHLFQLGFLKTQNLTLSLIEYLRQYILQYGRLITIHRFVHDTGGEVYIDRGDGILIKVTVNDYTEVDNGTDNIVFLPQSGARAFTLDKPFNADAFLHWLLSGLTMRINETCPILAKRRRRQLAYLLFVWIVATFLPNFSKTRMLLVFRGVKGSGKTTFGRRLLLTLFGGGSQVNSFPTKEGDFEVLMNDAHLLVMDNVDTHVVGICDKLAIAATGGKVQNRRLYTNSEIVTLLMRAFLILTTRTPRFVRDDVADRVLIIDLERINKFKPDNILQAETLQDRGRALASLIEILQGTLRALATGQIVENVDGFRNADFGRLALTIGRHCGCEQEAREALAYAKSLQADFAIEGCPVRETLEAWLSPTEPNAVKGSTGKGMTAGELHQALLKVAVKIGIKNFPSTPNALAQILTHSLEELRLDFNIRLEDRGSRKRIYHITPKVERIP